MKPQQQRTPISPLEKSIIIKLGTATYPPATASKRFVHDLCSGYIRELSERGRKFMAFIAHRFRRQYSLSEEEWAWVNAHRDNRATQQPQQAPPQIDTLPLFKNL